MNVKDVYLFSTLPVYNLYESQPLFIGLLSASPNTLPFNRGASMENHNKWNFLLSTSRGSAFFCLHWLKPLMEILRLFHKQLVVRGAFSTSPHMHASWSYYNHWPQSNPRFADTKSMKPIPELNEACLVFPHTYRIDFKKLFNINIEP